MRTKLILGGLAATAAAAIFGWWIWRPVSEELRLPGVVETQEVRLSSKVGGRIAKIAVREGDIVSPGQPLAYLEAPELEARREQYQAMLEAAQAQLAKANAGPRTDEKAAAKATADVARTKLQRLQAGYRAEEIEMAHGDWKAVQADLGRAKNDWQREHQLRNNGASSAAQLDAAWSAYSRLQEHASSVHAKWKMLSTGSRAEDVAEAKAELDRAEAQHRLLEQGTRPEEIAEAKAKVAELYAKIREIDAQLREAIVAAPETARVEIVAVRRGDTVAPNQPVARVLLAEDLWVKAYVPEPDLGRIRVGQQVKLTIDAFPGQKFSGVVSHIASISEFTPRNVATADERRNQVFAFKVRVTESSQIFKSGMAADVHIPVAQTSEQP